MTRLQPSTWLLGSSVKVTAPARLAWSGMLEVRPVAPGKFQLLLNQVVKDRGLWRDRTSLTERINFLMSIGVRFEPITGSILR